MVSAEGWYFRKMVMFWGSDLKNKTPALMSPNHDEIVQLSFNPHGVYIKVPTFHTDIIYVDKQSDTSLAK